MEKPIDHDNKLFTTFYIVRHGESVDNVKKVISGHANPILTAKGEDQARDAAKLLKTVHFDKIFSSDLLRAKRTAEIIAAERNLEVAATKRIRERSWGKHEGKSWDVLGQFNKLAAELAHEERFSHKVDEDVESDEEIATRLLTFIRETALAYPDKTILIATHGGIMKATLMKLGWATYNNFSTRHIDNTGYIKLTSDGVDFFIEDTYGIRKPNLSP